MRIVTLSYTPIDAPGGVPRWNRDFAAGIQCQHYSWWDALPAVGGVDKPIPEWDKAQVLGAYLGWSKKIGKDTIILADGFWAAGVENFVPREQVISVCHGNWSHTTKDDVDKGIPPEFPDHHRFQLSFRKKHQAAGGKLVAVSEFIAHQCKIQWDMDMPVVNNGIDLLKFHPTEEKLPRSRPLVIHFTTNAGKGFDHIQAVKDSVDADVYLLDEAEQKLGIPKYEALAQADLVVHPSAHEGNSYAMLETLASGVPLVAYEVGLMKEARRLIAGQGPEPIGVILDRDRRSPELTVEGVKFALTRLKRFQPREFAMRYSLGRFQQDWRDYLKKEYSI